MCTAYKPQAEHAPTDFDLRPNSHTDLPFNGLLPVIHVITWITIYLPTSEGRKAELAWLIDP